MAVDSRSRQHASDTQDISTHIGKATNAIHPTTLDFSSATAAEKIGIAALVQTVRDDVMGMLQANPDLATFIDTKATQRDPSRSTGIKNLLDQLDTDAKAINVHTGITEAQRDNLMVVLSEMEYHVGDAIIQHGADLVNASATARTRRSGPTVGPNSGPTLVESDDPKKDRDDFMKNVLKIDDKDKSPVAEAIRDILDPDEHPHVDYKLLFAFMRNPYVMALPQIKQFTEDREQINRNIKTLEETIAHKDENGQPHTHEDSQLTHQKGLEANLNTNIEASVPTTNTFDDSEESREKTLAMIHMFFAAQKQAYKTTTTPASLYRNALKDSRTALRDKQKKQIEANKGSFVLNLLKPSIETVFKKLLKEDEGLKGKIKEGELMKLIEYGDGGDVESWVVDSFGGAMSVKWDKAALVEGHLANMFTAKKLAGLDNRSVKIASTVLDKLRRARDNYALEKARESGRTGIDALNEFFTTSNDLNEMAAKPKVELMNRLTSRQTGFNIFKKAVSLGGFGAVGGLIWTGKLGALAIALAGTAASGAAGIRGIASGNTETTARMETLSKYIFWPSVIASLGFSIGTTGGLGILTDYFGVSELAYKGLTTAAGALVGAMIARFGFRSTAARLGVFFSGNRLGKYDAVKKLINKNTPAPTQTGT